MLSTLYCDQLSGTATAMPLSHRQIGNRRIHCEQADFYQRSAFSVMESQDLQTPATELPDDLVSALYSELRRLARMYLRNERRNHTLQPTALVHEAYLKLLQQHKVDWQNEAQVLGLAATLMRRVLASHAERRNAQKRAGGLRQVTLSLVESLANQSPTDFFEINQLLAELHSLDARQGRVAELRLFGGLNSSQVAQVLSISPATADRDWASAKLWLARELRRGAAVVK